MTNIIVKTLIEGYFDIKLVVTAKNNSHAS